MEAQLGGINPVALKQTANRTPQASLYYHG